MNDIVAIIPARGGSKGIPHKNIIEFCNKPLLAHSIEQALGCSSITNTYVSSDSKKILEVAEDSGALPIERPLEIAGDTASSEAALIHVIKSIKKKPKIIVFLQPTSPLRTSAHIDNAVSKFIEDGADSLFSAVDAGDLCLWESKALPRSITYDYRERKRRQEFPPHIVENGSIYITKTDMLLETKNRLCGKISHYLMDKWSIHEIDTLEDAALCEALMKKFI
jgi:N-acylneuraminate cytidylyltransferase